MSISVWPGQIPQPEHSGSLNLAPETQLCISLNH